MMTMPVHRFSIALDQILKPLTSRDLAEAPMLARLATEDDRLAVLTMAAAYFAEAADAFPTLSFDADVTNATFDAYIASADPVVFVVEHRRQIVGFLCASIQGLRFSRGIFAHCEAVYVRPENRGTRAAALLLAEFDQWSGIIKAKFSLGGNQNDLSSDRTARLYEKFGFKRVGFHMMKPRGA